MSIEELEPMAMQHKNPHLGTVPRPRRTPNWKLDHDHTQLRWKSALQMYQQSEGNGQISMHPHRSEAEGNLDCLWLETFYFYFDPVAEQYSIQPDSQPLDIGGNWSSRLEMYVKMESDTEYGSKYVRTPVLTYTWRTFEKTMDSDGNDRLFLFQRLLHNLERGERGLSRFGATTVGPKIRFYSFQSPPRDDKVPSPLTIEYVDQFLHPIVIFQDDVPRTDLNIIEDVENMGRVAKYIRGTVQKEAMEMTTLPQNFWW